jgi:hypothetical protein
VTQKRSLSWAVVLVLAASTGGACRSAYYAAWEQLGREKRDLLRNDVEKVGVDQKRAAESFTTALDRLRALGTVDAPELEHRYDALKLDLEHAEDRAGTVRARIRSIESIAADLFEEWEREIGTMKSSDLRQKSRAKLAATRGRYNTMHRSLRQAEASMDPVLDQLRDDVLFLKHNLNAKAVSGLDVQVGDIETDVRDLIERMQASSAQAEAFLGTLDD